MDPREEHKFMMTAKPMDWILDLRAMDMAMLV